MLSEILKTIDYAKRNGLTAAVVAAAERLCDRAAPYEYIPVTAVELEEQRKQYLRWKEAGKAPLISIVVPRHNTPPEFLEAMRASVAAQSYGGYELIETEEAGFSDNINAGIGRASGEFTGILDHDDVLTPDALFCMAKAIIDAREEGGDPLLVYSDEDKFTEDGGGLRYFAPNIKPDFNYDYLLSNNYICHFTLVKTGLVKELGFRSRYDGAQDHDLFLRIALAAMEEAGEGGAKTADAGFVHVPAVLYHWRSHGGSTAESGANKSYAFEAGKAAVMAHLDSRGIRAAVSETRHRGFFRVSYFDDIFEARPDIGAVGGKLTDGLGRMRGGLYSREGEVMFEGLPRGFSGGFTHRAACAQDAYAVDPLCMRVRPELMGKLSSEAVRIIREGEREKAVRHTDPDRCVRLCREIRDRGYRILWDPGVECRLGKNRTDGKI